MPVSLLIGIHFVFSSPGIWRVFPILYVVKNRLSAMCRDSLLEKKFARGIKFAKFDTLQKTYFSDSVKKGMISEWEFRWLNCQVSLPGLNFSENQENLCRLQSVFQFLLAIVRLVPMRISNVFLFLLGVPLCLWSAESTPMFFERAFASGQTFLSSNARWAKWCCLFIAPWDESISYTRLHFSWIG